MAKTKYFITLTNEERSKLTDIIIQGNESALTINRAKVLLLSDTNHTPTLSVPKIASITGVSHQTINKIRSIYAEKGFEIALHELERGKRTPAMINNSELVNNIKNLINEVPPNGRSKWTSQAITTECLRRGYVDKIERSTVARILKQYGFITKK